MTAFGGQSGACGRVPLGGLGRPAPQVLKDAPHDMRIVDQGRSMPVPIYGTI